MTAFISPRRLAGLVLCVVHLVLAGTLLVVGVVEFCVEPPVFDVLGPVQDRGSIPRDVFRVSRGLPACEGVCHVEYD